MIGKQHSQLGGIGKGGAQCRLPCDYLVKSDRRDLLHECGYTFANVFLKTMLCLDFGGFFLFLKMQFLGRHVCQAKTRGGLKM